MDKTMREPESSRLNNLLSANNKLFLDIREYSMVEAQDKEYASTMMTLKDKMNGILTASLDLLFPPSCPSCKTVTGNTDKPLCGECFSQLKFIKTPYCSCCGRILSGGEENHLCGDCIKSSWAFDKARSIFSYEDVIAGLIHNLKYFGETTGIETIGWVSRQTAIIDDFDNSDFIIPVPLHIKRLRQRGFNQAQVLAKSIFPDARKKIRTDLLARQTDTQSQTGLSGKERRTNLNNAFFVKKPSALSKKNLLLFDDVFTTGSTVHECARALKTAGANRVEVLTICRADKIFS